MKYFYTLLFLALYLNLTALDFCGNELTLQEAQEVFSYRQKIQQLKLNAKSAESDTGQIITIPIKAYIVGTDKGEKRYNLEYLLKQIDFLNEIFAETGFYFYFVPGIKFIDNSEYIGDGDANKAEKLLGDMLSRNYHHGAINIFYTSGTGLCGMAPFPGWSSRYLGKTGVLIENSCEFPQNKTLAHELGHHFDLMHTFQGWDSQNPNATAGHEYVTRNPELRNCEKAGDGFCDTPADVSNQDCDRTPKGKDGRPLVDMKGDQYNPDITLIMSYHLDQCTEGFSPEQITHMRDIVYTDTARMSYLKNQINDFTGVETTQLQTPLPGENVYADTPIRFEWDEVEGAEAYLFTVNKLTGSNGGGEVFQTIVTGQNFYDHVFPPTSDFLNKTFKWKVIPFKWTQPKAIASEERRVRIVEKPSGIFNTEVFDFSAYPNPAVIGRQLTLKLPELVSSNSKDSKIHIQISSINGQTVQDELEHINNHSITLNIDSQLVPGLYFIHFMIDDLLYRTKLLLTDKLH